MTAALSEGSPWPSSQTSEVACAHGILADVRCSVRPGECGADIRFAYTNYNSELVYPVPHSNRPIAGLGELPGAYGRASGDRHRESEDVRGMKVPGRGKPCGVHIQSRYFDALVRQSSRQR